MDLEQSLKQSIGKAIAFRRNELGLTQRQLAEKINISHVQVGEIERGNSLPSIITLVLLKAALGITDCNYFFAEINDTDIKRYIK